MYTPVDVSYRPAGITPELTCMVRYIFLALVRWEDKIREIAHGVTYMTCLSRVTARNKLLHLTLHPSKQSYNSGTGAVGITSSAATPNEIIRLYISILPFMHGVFFHENSMYPTMQQMVCMYPEYCGPLPRTIINRRRFCGYYESG